MKNKDLNIVDSDQEVEHFYEIGEEIDVLDSMTNSWFKAKIENKAGDLVYVSYAYQGEEIFIIKDCQSEETALPDTKSKFS